MQRIEEIKFYLIKNNFKNIKVGEDLIISCDSKKYLRDEDDIFYAECKIYGDLMETNVDVKFEYEEQKFYISLNETRY